MAAEAILLLLLLASAFCTAAAEEPCDGATTIHQAIRSAFKFNFDHTKVWNGITYGAASMCQGVEVGNDEVEAAPKVTMPQGLGGGQCTYWIIDPDAYNYVHWVVVDADCQSGENGQTISFYQQPSPPYQQSHRYVFLLFKQKGSLSGSNQYAFWDPEGFAKKKGLGDPLYATYMKARIFDIQKPLRARYMFNYTETEEWIGIRFQNRAHRYNTFKQGHEILHSYLAKAPTLDFKGLGGKCTLAMLSLDGSVVCHWFVINIDCSRGVSSGQVVTAYTPPSIPNQGESPRFAFLLFNHDQRQVANPGTASGLEMDVVDFATRNNLGNPAYASYIVVSPLAIAKELRDEVAFDYTQTKELKGITYNNKAFGQGDGILEIDIASRPDVQLPGDLPAGKCTLMMFCPTYPKSLHWLVANVDCKSGDINKGDLHKKYHKNRRSKFDYEPIFAFFLFHQKQDVPKDTQLALDPVAYANTYQLGDPLYATYFVRAWANK